MPNIKTSLKVLKLLPPVIIVMKNGVIFYSLTLLSYNDSIRISHNLAFSHIFSVGHNAA